MMKVFDTLRQEYTLEEPPLGEGGQGAVYRVLGQPRRIVKLITQKHSAEAITQRLMFLRRLDLKGLHVARPISVLRPPHVGYVAEFLDGMSPIITLMKPSGDADLLPWYIATGGLRRRLRLLAHAGEALVGLHERGLIYMDISPNNIFISTALHAVEAWLIDLDNLRYETDLSGSFYTASFGAPEVIKRKSGCTSLSDAWAFAVLTWYVLTLGHPLLGDYVNDGDPDLEDQAFRGELPWVAHSSDDRNVTSNGLPHEFVTSTRLLKLAQRTFEEGVERPELRASIGEWVSALHAAADQTRLCRKCGSTAFANTPHCPWCDAKWGGPVAAVQIRRWDPQHGFILELSPNAKICLTDEPLTLTRRITHTLNGLAGREPYVIFERASRGVRVSSVGGAECWYVEKPGAPSTEDKDKIGAHCPISPKPIGADGVTLPWNRYIVLFDHPKREQRVAELIGGDA